MTTISALQLIYSNVEKEQSPRGKGGFQTLFASPEFDRNQVGEIERRLVYFESASHPLKRLFFTLKDGILVVGQLTPLVGTDKVFRSGRYQGHCLAFRPDELAKIGNDPFVVFDAFEFVATVAEALALGDFATGEIGPTTVEVADRPAPASAADWEPEQLAPLVLASLHGARADHALTVIGDPDLVEEALRNAFRFIPSALRARCSFDTYFHRCNPVGMAFWAIGQLSKAPGRGGTIVDAGAREVLSAPAAPKTSYELWVLDAVRVGASGGDVDIDLAAAWCDWIDGHGPLPTGTLPASLLASLISAVSAGLDRRVTESVSRSAPCGLVERAYGPLHAASVGEYLVRLQIGIDCDDLCRRLWQSFLAAPERPNQADASDLWELARTTNDARPGALAAATQGDTDRLRTELARLDEASYRGLVRWVIGLGGARPSTLYVAGRAATLLAEVHLQSGDADRELPSLARALIAGGDIAALNTLSPLLPALGEDALGVVARLADDLMPDDPFRRVCAKEVQQREAKRVPNIRNRFQRNRRGDES